MASAQVAASVERDLAPRPKRQAALHNRAVAAVLSQDMAALAALDTSIEHEVGRLTLLLLLLRPGAGVVLPLPPGRGRAQRRPVTNCRAFPCLQPTRRRGGGAGVHKSQQQKLAVDLSKLERTCTLALTPGAPLFDLFDPFRRRAAPARPPAPHGACRRHQPPPHAPRRHVPPAAESLERYAVQFGLEDDTHPAELLALVTRHFAAQVGRIACGTCRQARRTAAASPSTAGAAWWLHPGPGARASRAQMQSCPRDPPPPHSRGQPPLRACASPLRPSPGLQSVDEALDPVRFAVAVHNNSRKSVSPPATDGVGAFGVAKRARTLTYARPW